MQQEPHEARSGRPDAAPDRANGIAANVAWLLLDRGGRLLLAFVVGVIVARRIGPAAYGAVSYAQATVSVLAFFGLAAIEAIVVRMLVDEPARTGEILGSAMLLRAAGALLAVLACLALGRGLHAESALALAIPLLSGVLVFQAADVADLWFRNRLRSRPAVLARLAALLAGAALRLWAASAPEPLLPLAAAMLAEAGLVAAALLVLLWREHPRLSCTRARALRILSQASPLLLSAVAIAIYVRLGFVILRESAGDAAVGQLAAATIAAEALHALPVAIAASYGPLLLARRRADAEAFERNFSLLLRAFARGALVLALAVSVFAPRLMALLFGPDYAPSGQVLSVLVWSIVFVWLSVASELWLVGHGLQRYVLAKTAIAALAYIVLCLALIPRYGATGAAVATVVTYALSAFASNALFAATRGLFVRQARALAFLDPVPRTARQEP